MNQTNKNSSPGPDRITPELVLIGGKNLVAALNIPMQTEVGGGREGGEFSKY